MSSRNRGPPIPAKGGPHGGPPPLHPHPHPHTHEQPPFGRALRGGNVQHPTLNEEMREAHYSLSGQRQQLPPHPAVMEERLAVQHDDIQALLFDNQRLAATHVALRQELEVSQHEIQRADKYVRTLHAENDSQMRELFEKSVKKEKEVHAVHAMKSELMQVHKDLKELSAVKQDLSAQVQMMTRDLGKVTSDLQQIPAVKAEIEGLRRELERARAAIEHEKKGFAESFDHGKVMENKLVTMAREMEKVRAELANVEKRARVAPPIGNPGVNYNSNYGNPEMGHPGYLYSVGYGMMPPNAMHYPAPAGAEGYPQYGPGPGAWASYDQQRNQGSR